MRGKARQRKELEGGKGESFSPRERNTPTPTPHISPLRFQTHRDSGALSQFGGIVCANIS